MIRKSLFLVAVAVLGVAAAYVSLPARADSSGADASLSCGQPISITFSGFTTGRQPYSANWSVTGGQSGSGQFSWSSSGATEETGITASAGATWEVTANWNTSGYSGTFDSGPLTCAAATTTTQVTVTPPPTTSTTTTTSTTPSAPSPGGGSSSSTTTVENDTTTTIESTTTVAPNPPTVDFTAGVGNSVGEVAFTGTPTAGGSPISSTVWSFGDGALSLDANPSHVYKQPGVYVVEVTVIDSSGLSAVAARQVTVTETTSAQTLRFTFLGPRLTTIPKVTEKLAKPKVKKATVKPAKKKTVKAKMVTT